MSAPVVDVAQRAAGVQVPRRSWRWLWAIPAALVAVVAMLAVSVAFHGFEGRALPTFPSLLANPDPSIAGTVAYYAAGSRCVRLVPAGGGASKDALCLPPWTPDPAQVEREGKEIGPQLRWRPDGRLEVTMLFMPVTTEHKGQPERPGWQKLVDVRTGAVEDVPAVDVPATRVTPVEPAVSPRGQRIAWKFDPSTGRAKVTLRDASGTRTLLSVHGPGEYTYSFGPVWWAPSFRWIAVAEADRLLAITPTDPPVTRVLVAGAAFAVAP